jgi:hypothetical protein
LQVGAAPPPPSPPRPCLLGRPHGTPPSPFLWQREGEGGAGAAARAAGWPRLAAPGRALQAAGPPHPSTPQPLNPSHPRRARAEHFLALRPPKVLLTTSYKPTALMYQFLSELLELFPAAEYYKRNGFPLKKIVELRSACCTRCTLHPLPAACTAFCTRRASRGTGPRAPASARRCMLRLPAFPPPGRLGQGPAPVQALSAAPCLPPPPPPPPCRFCNNREYTDILVFNEERKEVNGMMHIHLPDGPTAQYRWAPPRGWAGGCC